MPQLVGIPPNYTMNNVDVLKKRITKIVRGNYAVGGGFDIGDEHYGGLLHTYDQIDEMEEKLLELITKAQCNCPKWWHAAFRKCKV